MQELSVVGKSVPRIEASEKVTGSAKFSGDIKLPGMLYGKIKRSPYAHARVLRVDTSKAEKLPGVKAVLTIDNVPRVLHSSASPPLAVVKDQYIFDEEVRFVGDGVAAVAAVSKDAAEEALDLIEVEYEELPAVFDPEEAMKPGAPKVHDTESNLVMPPMKVKFGDVEKGFQEADYIFEDRYVTSRQVHCFLEPYVCVCYFDRAGNLTIWTSTQGPSSVHGMLSEVLGMPMTKIKVLSEYVGGGFGGKIDMYQQEFICALLAMKTGRPVKIEYTREECFIAGRSRRPTIIYLKQGVKKDGTLTARQARAILNAGAHCCLTPAIAGLVTIWLSSLYRCPNVDVVTYSVYTNQPQSSTKRGLENPSLHFAFETQMDAIADKLGIDPRELTLKNHIQVGDVVLVGPHRIPVQSCGLEECIRLGAEKIGWKEKRGGRNAGVGRRRGVGMGTYTHCSRATHPAVSEQANAFIKINEDGTVTLMTGQQDIGQGLNTALAQIAAEELGVSFEAMHVVSGDTSVCPYGRATKASGGCYTAGQAVKAAAAEAKKKLLARAAKMLEVAVEDLEARGGKIWARGTPEKVVSIKDVAFNAVATVPGESFMGIASIETAQSFTFGAQFAEVEVNTETGRVTLLKLVAAADMGKAINPAIVEGQIEGALQHGMGYALTEDMVVDKETGVTLNPGFLDYRMPTAPDMPEITTILVEPIDPLGPFGAKGVGEPSMIPTAAAVANAIYDAVGVRIKELPITSEKVLKALREKARV